MKILKYMALALAAVATMSCVQEQFELDPNKVPSASDLQVKIDVDQATNYVTFSIENQGMVPMWLFGEEKIDGKANKKYAYTGNGLQLRLRDAGAHSVEVKAYNAHGVSVGSKVVEFTLDNTYRDPFDPTKYKTMLAGSESKTWEWNNTVAGHFGCGETAQTPDGWWSAPVNNKEGMGLYDDRMTFSADGKYTYNPGDGGTVYVNTGSGYGAEYNTNDGQDYQVPIESFTADYTFENNWNDAGIEEVYLVLAEGANLSYIPHMDALANPRYLILDQTTKKVTFAHYSATANNGGPIAWKYQFVLEGSVTPEPEKPQPGEVVFDPNSDRNMWKNAVTTDHHFWFANNDWGEISPATVTSDGNHHEFVLPEGLGSQQWQGQFFFQNTGLATSAAKTYDFYCVLNADADHSGVTVKLCAQDDDGAIITDGRYALKAFEDYVVKVVAAPGIDCENLKLVFDFGGGQGGSKVVVKDIILQEHIDGGSSGPAPFDPASPDNLWNNAVTTDHHFWFADEGWGAIENATVTSDGGTYTFGLPAGLGSQQWQGQFFFQNTGIKSEAAKTYDFHLVLMAEADHAGVTVKLCAQDDDAAIITDGRYALTAYEEFSLDVYGAQGIDCENLKLVFDFGGGQGGTNVIVKDIVFREAKSVSVEPEIPGFDPSSPDNLWNNAVTTDHHFWFADEGWGAIENATVTSEGGTHTFVLPEGLGSQQWQGQFFFQNTGLKSEAAKTYDFHLVLMAEADHAGVTVKLCAQDDDAAIITDGRYALTAYEEFSLDVYGAQGIDCENLKLVFDFGGGQGGSTVIVKDIVFREAKSASTPEPETPGFDPSSPDNLWNNAVTTDHHFWFADEGWGAIENATVTSEGGTHTFVLPEGLGSQQWQGQFFFQNTGLKSEASKTYDFHLVLMAEADHAGVTVKLCAQDDDAAIITDGRYALTAYEEFSLDVYGAQGIDCENLKLVFDFGGGQGGSTVVVKDIVFREHI